jgi:hypothetical protein
LNDSLWSGPERYRSINPDSAADELIKVKLHRNVATEAVAGAEACDGTACAQSEAAVFAKAVGRML